MALLRHLATTAFALSTALALSACGASPTPSAEGASVSPTISDSSAATSVSVEDNRGSKTVTTNPASVGAFDNRTFETLFDWGVELAVAPIGLMPATIGYQSDTSIADVGTHNEPNLELIVAAEPDVIIVGQRFTQFYDDIAALTPEATLIELDPRDGEPFADELKRQVTVLGEIFSKQDEAQQLVDDYDAALARVKAAYDPAQTAMAINVSGGEIGFIAPGKGRTLGPVFTDVGLTPALEVPESSDNHEGDEISVEAIAASNPEWILVLDRSAAIDADNPDFKPAAEVIEANAALKNVPALQKGQVVYLPADTYLNESIQTYTEFLNDFADALEAAKQA